MLHTPLLLLDGFNFWLQPSRLHLIVLAMAGLTLTACATWQEPERIDDSLLRARAVTAEEKGIQVSAAVLSADNSKRFLGANVNAKEILPVWVEVTNGTPQTLWLLRAGADPDYFSPHEAAWLFRSPLQRAYNEKLDDHFDQLGFQSPIAPGEKRNGILFVNPQYRVVLLTVDLLGQGEITPFTLFLPVPDDVPGKDVLMPIKRYTEAHMPNLQRSARFRAALENIPFCAANQAGVGMGDPINVVFVGELEDVAAALGHLKYRRIEKVYDSGQRLFNRQADAIVRKAGKDNIPANWLRIWVAPLRYRDRSVFVAQAGRATGGRFSKEDGADPVLHPMVDEARNVLIHDMIYSGRLATIDFTKPGASVDACSIASSGHHKFSSDGLRAVFFIDSSPQSLSDVEVMEWEPLKRAQAGG